MTTRAAVLLQAKQAENSQTTQYTSTNVTTIIDKFTATNVSGGAVTISVNVVESGDTAGTDNLIVQAKSIQAGETYLFPEMTNRILGAGDFVSTVASAATSINIRMEGRVIS